MNTYILYNVFILQKTDVCETDICRIEIQEDGK